jgi:hypothetical protein
MFYSCSFIYLIILVGNLNLFIFYRQQVNLRRFILHIIIWFKTFFFFSCSFVAPKEIDTSYGSRLLVFFFFFFLVLLW